MDAGRDGSMGEELWCEGKWDELTPMTKAELEAARKAGDSSQEAEVLGRLGFLFGEVGQGTEAIRAIRGELRLRRILGDPEELAQTLSILSWRLAETGRSSSAIRCLRLALTQYRAGGDEPEVFLCLVGLADHLWKQGRFLEAQRAFEEALPMAPHHFPAFGKAKVLAALSLLAERLGQCEQALELQHGYVQELCALDQDFHAAKALIRLANLHAQGGRAWEARELLHEAFLIFKRLGVSEEAQ